MKKLLSLLLATACIPSVFSQESLKVDTLYYNAEWQTVRNPEFATYKRIAEVDNNTNTRKHYRDYYISGELQSEGFYLSLDKMDDKKSVFDGDYTLYHKNGKVKEKGKKFKGVTIGEVTLYYENGLIHEHCTMKNGKMDGIYTQFSEDGSQCIQIEYANGKPLYDYYTASNAQGFVCKLRLSDNKPIYESPEASEMKTEHKDGSTWQYYVKNGMMIALNNSMVKDYGKYFRINIVIANNSFNPIEFYPSNIMSSGRDKKDKHMALKVFTVEEYMKKVNRKQNWMSALNGLAEGLAASNAGYSSSTTNTSTYSSGTASYSGSAAAIGSGGWAVGGYSGTGSYSGSSHTTSTTQSYDGAAAYQAQVIASDRIAAYDNALIQEQAIKQEGYLKTTTIYPGETISGYIHIERKKGKTMKITIPINGAMYVFPWSIEN